MPARFYETITVDGVDLCDELDCVIEGGSFEMEPPEPVETWVEVPGRIDGPIDASEALTGYPTYGLREIKCNFLAVTGGREGGEALLSAAMGLLHHKSATLELSWDPGYTYKGRVSVSALRRELYVAGFTLSAKLAPYKFLRHVTVQENCAGGKTLVLPCGDAPTVPTWTFFSRTSLNFGGTAYEIGPGNYQLPGIVLRRGDNYVYAYTDGNGDGSLRYGYECESDTLLSWKDRTIADWIWKTRPTGGPVRADYDWKDL